MELRRCRHRNASVSSQFHLSHSTDSIHPGTVYLDCEPFVSRHRTRRRHICNLTRNSPLDLCCSFCVWELYSSLPVEAPQEVLPAQAEHRRLPITNRCTFTQKMASRTSPRSIRLFRLTCPPSRRSTWSSLVWYNSTMISRCNPNWHSPGSWLMMV